MNNFNKNDGQETIRQTLERVVREKEKQQQYNNGGINYQTLAQEYANSMPYDEAYRQKPKSNYAWTNAPNYNTSAYTSPEKYSVLGGAVSGFAEGIMGGTERFANGLTGGVYGESVDYFTNNSYTNRQNKLQNRANNVGSITGFTNMISNKIIDADAEALKGVLAGKLVKFGK